MILYMVKDGSFLRPAGAVDMELFEKIPGGKPVEVQVHARRNIKFHRLVWGLVHLCFKHQSHYTNPEDLMDDFKIATGHFRLITRMDGKQDREPESISFAKMDEVKFRSFFDKLLDIVIARIIPGVNREAFEEQVYLLIGEPPPSTLNH